MYSSYFIPFGKSVPLYPIFYTICYIHFSLQHSRTNTRVLTYVILCTVINVCLGKTWHFMFWRDQRQILLFGLFHTNLVSARSTKLKKKNPTSKIIILLIERKKNLKNKPNLYCIFNKIVNKHMSNFMWTLIGWSVL